MRRTAVVLGIALLVSVTVFSGGAVSQSFGLSVTDSVETPERTITHDVLGTHTFSAVGVTTPGEPLSVSVTVPSGETHFLDLYNGQDRIDTVRLNEGSETVSIPTDGLDPGSYFLRIISDGQTETLYPVVIQGYDINVDQSENTSSDELAVTATVTPTASTGTADSVEAVVWNDDIEKRETLTSESGGSYVGTVPLSAFGDESFDVHVAARGEETVNGQKEILAIGEGDSKTGDEEPADDSTDEGTNDGSDGGTTGTDPVSDADDDGQPAQNNTPVNGSIDGNTPVNGSTEGSIGENETTDSVDETTNRTDEQGDDEPSTDGSVIEPTDPNETAADDGAREDASQIDDDVPLSPAVTFIAFIASGLLAFRRSKRS